MLVTCYIDVGIDIESQDVIPHLAFYIVLYSLNSKFNAWPETTLANTSTSFNKTRSRMCSGSSVGPVLAEACSTTQQYQSKPGSNPPPIKPFYEAKHV